MAARKPQQMCVLRIGYMTLVLPSSKGMKVMQELQEAVEAEWNIATRGNDRYLVKGRPELQVSLIDNDQVVMPGGGPREVRQPRLISRD